MPGVSFNTQRRIRSAKANEFSIISSFNLGYRNREDKTNLPGQTLIVGSQNVLTNVSGRIGNRKGYTLYGAANTAIAPIVSSYDWEMHTGDERNLRAGFLTSAGNDGKLQYNYNGTWTDLITGLTSVKFNFCDYWDKTLNQSKLLMVNGASSITEWTGGSTELRSASVAGIAKVGTTTWAEEGFYTTGVHTVVIAGVSYGATSGWGTTTLRGVTPDPSASTPGVEIHQKPETTLNSAMTSAPSGFNNDLIANLQNYVYLGSLTNQTIYISKQNDYKNFSFSSPRLEGEGAILILDGSPKSFIVQENDMYISASKDQWYQISWTPLSTEISDTLSINVDTPNPQRLKTASLQGAQSQGLTAKIPNYVAYISFEPICGLIGRIPSIFETPQIENISTAIVNDMNGYDFTDGQVIYHKNYIYISAPKNSTVLIYNMTNPKEMYWEAPQILPIARFSIINGELYGHSYYTSETYKLFDGYNDNGHAIDSKAIFAFDSYEERVTSKGFNQYYVEGYISLNTVLNLGLQYDLDGCATNLTKTILGTDSQIVCLGSNDNLLGKFPLGEQPLGANISQTTATTLPPKFRTVKTMPQVPFYEYSPSFGSQGVDQNWEVIAFGPAWSPTSEGNNPIVQ